MCAGLDRGWWERSTRFRTGAEGWLRLEVTFQDARHAEWALWQLGTDAEALAASWLRDAMDHRATAIAVRYAPPS